MTTKSASARQEAVYVYEGPLRLWHWINALSIIVLAVTGYFIGSPLPSLSGEASDHFLMGYIRFAHFSAGYILIIGFLLRIYWAFVGNAHARQIFLPPLLSSKWWGEVLHEIKNLQHQTGMRHLLCRVQLPGLTTGQIEASIRLLAEDVRSRLQM